MLGLVARLWLFCAVCTCTLITAHGQFSCQTEPSGQARTNLVGSGQLYFTNFLEWYLIWHTRSDCCAPYNNATRTHTCTIHECIHLCHRPKRHPSSLAAMVSLVASQVRNSLYTPRHESWSLFFFKKKVINLLCCQHHDHPCIPIIEAQMMLAAWSHLPCYTRIYSMLLISTDCTHKYIYK